MKNLFNLTLITLFLITSCDKKEAQQIKPKTEKEITAEQMKNSNNPYDKEGELHNKFLDYFIAKADGEKEMNRDKLFVIYEGFHNENKLEFGDEGNRGFSSLMDAFSELGIGGPYLELDICKKYPAICNITGTGPYNPVEILAPTDGTTSTERTLSYIKEIAGEEAKILRDEKVEDEQKKALLNYYAVARHSAAYWHNVINVQKSKSAWYDSFSQGEADVAAIDIIVADAVGAGIGVAVAGVGVGPGAGIASSAAALYNLWKWVW